MSELSRSLRRSERALRCKMQRLGMSAKVNDGWGFTKLRTELHIGARSVLREVNEGRLRVQSADVKTSVSQTQINGRIVPPQAPVEALVAGMRLTGLHVCGLARAGRWRVMHMRITDASVYQFYRKGLLGERVAWLSPALRWWLTPNLVLASEESPSCRRLPQHLRILHLCPWCGRQVRGNAYFRHVSWHRRALAVNQGSMARHISPCV